MAAQMPEESTTKNQTFRLQIDQNSFVLQANGLNDFEAFCRNAGQIAMSLGFTGPAFSGMTTQTQPHTVSMQTDTTAQQTNPTQQQSEAGADSGGHEAEPEVTGSDSPSMKRPVRDDRSWRRLEPAQDEVELFAELVEKKGDACHEKHEKEDIEGDACIDKDEQEETEGDAHTHTDEQEETEGNASNGKEVNDTSSGGTATAATAALPCLGQALTHGTQWVGSDLAGVSDADAPAVASDADETGSLDLASWDAGSAIVPFAPSKLEVSELPRPPESCSSHRAIAQQDEYEPFDFRIFEILGSDLHHDEKIARLTNLGRQRI